MGSNDCCRYLEWDSAHFEMRIGRANATRLADTLLPEIREWRRSTIENTTLASSENPKVGIAEIP